jgi:anti-sigma regulatory factor (Ser/Thr protein kinase)
MMILSKPKTFRITNQEEIGKAKSLIYKIASGLGFNRRESTEIMLAVSEIVGNAVKFAGKGTVSVQFSGNKKTLKIIVQDKGPGIKNTGKSMEEGHSAFKHSLGLGLGTAKRMMDEFSIKSKPGRGTKVAMKKYLPIPEEEIEYGVVSLADGRYVINGDAYVIKEFEGDKVLLAVIDGLGEGEKANKAANFAKDWIEENYKSPIATIIRRCDKSLKKQSGRGSAMGLLLLKPRSLGYIGVGDTFVKVFSRHKLSLHGRGGIVGQSLPKLKLQKFSCNRRLTIIMCSDGIHFRFTEKDLPLKKSAQQIADFIMKNYIREYGDATVLVAKRKK